MTGTQRAARPRPAIGVAADGHDQPGQQGPVVVLAYAYSGAVRIQRLLSDTGVLACTAGTGLLPACDQAAAAWRQVDRRDGPLSSLAIASIRALAGGMISVILAGAGRPRWCEIAFSPPSAAETFAQLYPGTKFVCLHRRCPDVIRAGVQANPWGLAGTSLARFTAAYPGSTAAAMAAYWAECTGPLLRFEEAHPAACYRLRYEDLADHPDQEARKLFAFLGLDPAISFPGPGATLPPGEQTRADLAEARVPAGHLSPELTERVNDLQARLKYPPLA